MTRHLLTAFTLLLPNLAPCEPTAPARVDPDAIAVVTGQSLEYVSGTFQTIGELHAKATGIPLVIPEQLAPFELHLAIPGPLTNADVARLIENIFLLHGFVIDRSHAESPKLTPGVGPWKINLKKGGKPLLPPSPDPAAIAIPAGQNLGYENISAETCARLLCMHTGKRILLAPGVERPEFDLKAPGPLNNREVARKIETTLAANGIFLKEFSPGEAVLFPISHRVNTAPATPPTPRVRRVPSP